MENKHGNMKMLSNVSPPYLVQTLKIFSKLFLKRKKAYCLRCVLICLSQELPTPQMF